MKKIFLLALLSITTFTFAQETSSQGSDGHGGAGVRRSGRVMTFYSAGDFYVEKFDLISSEIPELLPLMNYLNHHAPYLSKQDALKYIKALQPNDNRRYVRVTREQFDEDYKDVRMRILEEYRQQTGASENEALELFAVTDTNSNTTFLLPEFFELQHPNEKQAILMHEAHWLVSKTWKTKPTHREVMDFEMSFQGTLDEAQGSPVWGRRVMDFMARGRFSNHSRIKAAMDIDIRTKALNALLDSKGRLPLIKITGQDYINCLSSAPIYFIAGRTLGSCSNFIYAGIAETSNQFPNSVLLKLLISEDIFNHLFFLSTDENQCGLANCRGTSSIRITRKARSCAAEIFSKGRLILNYREFERVFPIEGYRKSKKCRASLR